MALNGTQRKKQLAFTSAAGVALTGLILVLLNVLSNWGYLRLDLTHHNAYSLSVSSKKLVRSLEDPVIIKAYFSPNLPVPYNTYARYVKDILAEYRSASRGKLRFEFIPPQPPQAFEEQAMAAGMTPLQFQEMARDQMQIRRGFMGLTMFYRDQSEMLPVVKNIQDLEYDLTSRLARMARKEKKVIRALSGHGELNWRGSQMKIAQDLPAFYDLDHPLDLPLATTEAVKADALLVVGPRQKYDEKTLWVLDQTLMSGVPVAFFIDTHRLLLSNFMVMPQPTGLEDLLKTYGVEIRDRLVYDAQCETIGMTQNLGGFAFTSSVRYPFVPQITNVEKDHPILRGIEALALPFPSPIQSATLPSGVTFTPLLLSSVNSWLAPPHTSNVAPNALPKPAPDETHGPFALAGVLEGTFPSYFANKPSPVPGVPVISQSPKTAIFILGTSHLLDPDLPEFPGAGALVTNALAYLSHDDTLLGIQSKGEILRPLKRLSPRTPDVVKLLCLLGVPLLPIGWGLLRWRRRTQWRRRLTHEFTAVEPPSLP